MQHYFNKWHDPECLKYSNDPNTYWIHGHVCTHELFCDIDYFRLLQPMAPYRFVFAHHPMMNPSDYDQVCSDFGYALPKMYYDPIVNMTPDQLYDQFCQLHWKHRPNEIESWDASEKVLKPNGNFSWSVFLWQTCFPHVDESSVRSAIIQSQTSADHNPID